MHAVGYIQYILLLLFLLIGWGESAVSFAASNDPIRSAQDGLQDLPWYDDQADQLKSPRMPKTKTATRREDQPGNELDWSWDWDWNWNPGNSLAGLGEIFKLLVWILLFFVIGVLVYLLVRTYLNTNGWNPDADVGRRRVNEAITDQQRIENLPLELENKAGDFLTVSQRYYESGDFSEAIVYLFSHRLVQLDKCGFIRLTKGKTNRQYLGEVARSKDMQQILGQTIVAFEHVFFGDHSLSREQFENCWRRNKQFHILVSQKSS